MIHNNKKYKLSRIVVYFCVVIFSWFLLHSIIIVWDGFHDELSVSDTGVVLGNKVELNGKPSERLKSRLDKAMELYNEQYIRTIIVSGGIGKEGFDEAKVMRQYLIEKGIPEDKIFVDNEGYNTQMTAMNTKAIMEEQGLSSAIIITQYFHITRTELAFKKGGINPVWSAHADIVQWRDLYSITREFFAYYKYLFL